MRKEAAYGPVLLLAGWYLIARFELLNPVLLPPPDTVLTRAVELVLGGGLLKDLLVTGYRSIVGLLLAAGAGIPLGLVMGFFALVHASWGNTLDFFRSIPATALLPLFMLAFGIGDPARILLVAFSGSLIVILNTAYGVQNSSKTRLNLLRTLRASTFQCFTKSIFPDSLPHVAAGLRTTLSLALVVVVVSEMLIGTTVGLGHRIYDSELVYDTPQMYSSIIFTGLLGLFFNRGFVAAEKKLVHWTGR